MLRGLDLGRHLRLEALTQRLGFCSESAWPVCPALVPTNENMRHQARRCITERHCIDSANSPAPVSLKDAAADLKPKPVYRIAADTAQALLSSPGSQHRSTEALLRSYVEKAKEYAMPVLSHFHVGAVGLGGSGAIYLGHNVEFAGVPLNYSIHAEQFLLVNCMAHGEKEIQMIVVSEAPCGHCRQFFCEISNADTVRFSFGNDPSFRSLDEILPARFGPHDLLHKDITPLLTPQSNKCLPTNEARQAVLHRKGEPAFTTAAVTALRAARMAYAPYTQCPSAVSIIMMDGTSFTGTCVESAAFNPTISPFHAAFILAITGGLHDVRKIKEVVLVEYSPVAILKKKHEHIRHISYKHSIKLLLKALKLPQVPVTVLGLRPFDAAQLSVPRHGLQDMQDWLDSY